MSIRDNTYCYNTAFYKVSSLRLSRRFFSIVHTFYGSILDIFFFNTKFLNTYFCTTYKLSILRYLKFYFNV